MRLRSIRNPKFDNDIRSTLINNIIYQRRSTYLFRYKKNYFLKILYQHWQAIQTFLIFKIFPSNIAIAEALTTNLILE